MSTRHRRVFPLFLCLGLVLPAGVGTGPLGQAPEAAARKRKTKGAAATKENFRKKLASMLKYAVKRMKIDSGAALTKHGQKWMRKICKKLEGNPIDKCKQWYPEVSGALYFKYKPEEKAKLDAAFKNIEKITKDAMAAAAKKKRDEAERRRRSGDCGRETAVWSDSGKFLFCGLRDTLIRKVNGKVRLKDWAEKNGWGQVPKKYRPAGVSTAHPDPTGTKTMMKWQDDMRKSGVCSYDASAVRGKIGFDGLVKKFRAEDVIHCRDVLLDAMRAETRQTLNAWIDAWGSPSRLGDHAMHKARQRRWLEGIKKLVDEAKRYRDTGFNYAKRLKGEARIQQFRSMMKQLQDIERRRRILKGEDDKSMAKVNKWADRFEKAARVAQKIIIKAAGGVVFVFTGGNKWAQCLTEAGLQTAADTVGERIISSGNKLTVGGVGLSMAKNLASKCGGNVMGAAGNVLKGAAKKLFDLGTKTFGKIWSKLGTWGEKAVQFAKDHGQKAIDFIKKHGSKAVEAIQKHGRRALEYFKRYKGNALAKLRELGEKGLEKVKDLGGKALDTARNLGGKALDTARNLGGKALDTARNLGGKAVDLAKKYGRGAADLARKYGGKVVQVVEQHGKRALDALRRYRQKAADAMARYGSKALDYIKKYGGKAFAKLRKLGGKVKEAASVAGRKIREGLGALGQKVAKAWDALKRLGGKARDVLSRLKGRGGLSAKVKALLGRMGRAGRTAYDLLKKLGRKGMSLLRKLLDRGAKKAPGSLRERLKAEGKKIIKKEVIGQVLKEGACRVALPLALAKLIESAPRGARGLKRMIGDALEKLGQKIFGRSARASLPRGLLAALDRISDRMVVDGAARFRAEVRGRCLRLGCGAGDGWGKIAGTVGRCLVDAAKGAFVSAGVGGLKAALVEAIDGARQGLRVLRSKVSALIERFRDQAPDIGRLTRALAGASASGVDLFLRMARACPEKLTEDLRASAGAAADCVVRAGKDAWRVTVGRGGKARGRADRSRPSRKSARRRPSRKSARRRPSRKSAQRRPSRKSAQKRPSRKSAQKRPSRKTSGRRKSRKTSGRRKSRKSAKKGKSRRGT